jgi:hypothetical protein
MTTSICFQRFAFQTLLSKSTSCTICARVPACHCMSSSRVADYMSYTCKAVGSFERKVRGRSISLKNLRVPQISRWLEGLPEEIEAFVLALFSRVREPTGSGCRGWSSHNNHSATK